MIFIFLSFSHPLITIGSAIDLQRSKSHGVDVAERLWRPHHNIDPVWLGQLCREKDDLRDSQILPLLFGMRKFLIKNDYITV
jgi:hypothetical protein